MSYQKPGFKNTYENYIGGQWVAPVDGEYFENISPVDGSVIARVARSNGKDIDLAVEAALKAAKEWGRTSVTERSNLLFNLRVLNSHPEAMRKTSSLSRSCLLEMNFAKLWL